MSYANPDPLLLPSVLDRLIDERPHERRETERSRAQLLSELKQSVKRDIENLLNTRLPMHPFPDPMPDHYHFLEQSLVNYGIPDFSGLSMGAKEQREVLRRKIERVLLQFETRFKEVHVSLVDNRDDHRDRTIRFRIEGLLHADPAPEPVAFDSMMQPATGDFRIQGGEG